MNKSTPDYEKNIQKDFAIENLQRECRILEARIQEYNSFIESIDNQVITKINSMETTKRHKDKLKSKYQTAITEEENKSKEIWKTKFEKIKESNSKEQSTNKEIFVTIVDDNEEQQQTDNYTYHHQKNYHRYQQRRPPRNYNNRNNNRE